MKRILALFFSLSVIIMSVPFVSAETQIQDYENFKYQISDSDEITIIDCKKNASGEIAVPEKIEGRTVTAIGAQAFENCKSITSITIPVTVRSIGFLAFWQCTGLKKITIPDAPVSIECNILSDTAYFNDAKNWKDGALYIGNHLIRTKASVKSNFKVKDGTVTIASGAFKDSVNINKITIPDSVVAIGNDALNKTKFYKNKSNWKAYALYAGKHLIEVADSAKGDIKIKENTLTIADDAFDFCKNIKSIDIPDSVTKISRRAFIHCTALESVNIPKSLTQIGDFAFEGCKSLKEINYGGTSADFEAVKICRGNTELDNATIAPKKYEFKKDSQGNLLSFAYETVGDTVVVTYCDPETVGSVTIPEILENKPVTKIAEEAFKDCSIVNEIILPSTVETVEKSAFANSGITKILIPEKLTTIEENVFSGCVALETVEISSGLKKINKNAFKGCAELVDIRFDGDEAAWSKIKIDEGNSDFEDANVIFSATKLFGIDIHDLILPIIVGSGVALVIIAATAIKMSKKKKA